MNQILYERRCKCKEEFSITKRKKSTPRSKGKPLKYPEAGEVNSITFFLDSKNPLSTNAKIVFHSFQNKYLYHAIEDILYLPNLNSDEQEKLLSFIYSPIMALQNYKFIDFFDIWIHEVYIEDVAHNNRFLNKHSTNLKQSQQIKIKFFYKTKAPTEKQDALW